MNAKRGLLLFLALLAVVAGINIRHQQMAQAQTASGFVAPGPGGAPDPCNYAPHNSVPMAQATTATTDVIAAKAGREISICHIEGSIGGAIQIMQGTGTTGTGLVPLTGAMTALLAQPANATLMRAAVGQDVYIKSTGSDQGWITYVYENQQPPIVPTSTPFVTATPT